MEQFAAGTKLEDDVVILPRLGEIDQSDNVGMIELPHDLDLFQDICALGDKVSTCYRQEKVSSAGQVGSTNRTRGEEGWISAPPRPLVVS